MRSWYYERDRSGNIAPLRKRDCDSKIVVPEVHATFLLQHLHEVNCQLYVPEMVKLLKDTFNIQYDQDQIEAVLHRKNWTEKAVTLIAMEQDAAERSQFREFLKARHLGGDICPRQLVFCDVSHMRMAEARRKYGWALRGQPAFVRARGIMGHDQSFSTVCTFGIKGTRTVTPIRSGVGADEFMEVLQNVIIPTLGQVGEPFSILILDNSSVHNKWAIKETVEAHGSSVYWLPPYSYDFNPIEPVFHLAKADLRAAYFNDQNPDLITEFTRAMYESVTAEIACNFFRGCHIYVPAYVREWACGN